MSPTCRRLRTLLRNDGSGPRPCAFLRLQIRSRMNAVCRMMSRISMATSGPPCLMLLPSSPIAGRFHHSVMEMTSAAMKPKGTMKRLMSRMSSGSGGERRHRLLLSLVMIEHHDQLRHGEHILQPLAQPAQLDLAAPAPVVGINPHQHADRERVEG